MHIFVTGAASGIGLTLTKLLLQRGHTVTAMARNLQRAQFITDQFSTYRKKIHTSFADLSSFASLRQMINTLPTDQTYDRVIHCAGMLMPPEKPTLTEDGIEITLQVNAVSVWFLNQLLLPKIRKPGRIVALTSSLHKPGSRGANVQFNFEDMPLTQNYNRERAYKNSKLALIWVMREWERRYAASSQLHADAICPGFVPTTAARYTHGFSKFLLKVVLPLMPFAVSRLKAASDIVRLVEEPVEKAGGRYFENERLATPSADALNGSMASRFVQWIEACGTGKTTTGDEPATAPGLLGQSQR